MNRKKIFWMGGCFWSVLLLMVLAGWQKTGSGSPPAQEAGRGETRASSATPRQAAAQPASRRPRGGDIAPETTVWDPYPTFNGIALDTETNRVAMSDLNRHSVLIYDRTATSKSSEPTTPLKHIIGPATEMGF